MDEPCTVGLPAGEPIGRLGVAPHELAAMTLDAASLGTAGSGWVWDALLGSYLDNREYTRTDPLGAGGCAAVQNFGRVTGASTGWYKEDSPQLQAATFVHVFLDEAGAAAFVDWFPGADATAPANADACAVTSGSVTSSPLDGVGGDARLVTATTADCAFEWALVRHGNLVGEVRVVRAPTVQSTIDVAGAATQLAARIAGGATTGSPFDTLQLLAAPLPLSAYGPAYSQYEWGMWYNGCTDTTESAARALRPEAAAADMQAAGRLEGCAATYWAPQEAGTAPTGTVLVGTNVSVFRDEAAATDYLARVTADGAVPSGDADAMQQTGAPAERFAVEALPDAVGSRAPMINGDSTTFETRVDFVHGRTVATVFIIENDPNADHLAEVSALATTFEQHLTDILGS